MIIQALTKYKYIRMNNIRLNKALSILGVCSRREADALIRNRLIKVNGSTVQNLGMRVSEADTIYFNEKAYSLKTNKPESRVWLYYKKVGFITSHKDERNRRTVFEDVRDKMPCRVMSVGRLDFNSEGLLLLTNDGTFVRFAETSRTGWERVYQVRVFGKLSDRNMEEITKGILINGIVYTFARTLRLREGKTNTWYECTLLEGKNREIRKIFAHFGLLVNRLVRIKYGPYTLSDMRPGEIREAQISNSCREWNKPVHTFSTQN
jgi:23S rRNA pseudouridine2605 synthase